MRTHGLDVVSPHEGQWQQTDGSVGSLQYARKVNAHTWVYKQWVDKPYCDISVSEGDKIQRWDDPEWTIAEIDLSEYTRKEIEESLASFGYTITHYESNTHFYITNTESYGEGYSEADSMQLACECIFENNFFDF